MCENLTVTKLKSYTEFASESTTLKNLLKTTIKKLNGKLTIISLFHKMIYTPWHREADFGGHPFDIPIIYTDPNAIDFDGSHTQGPDTVLVARSYFHDSSDGQNRETRPSSDPTVLHPSNPESHGQSQDIEITEDLTHNDNSKRTTELSTDTETACEPMPQPPLEQ